MQRGDASDNVNDWIGRAVKIKRYRIAGNENVLNSAIEPIGGAGGVPGVSVEPAEPCHAGWRASALGNYEDGFEGRVVAETAGDTSEAEVGEGAVQVAGVLNDFVNAAASEGPVQGVN